MEALNCISPEFSLSAEICPVCDYYGRVVGIAKSVAVKNGQQNAANLNFGVDIQLVRKELDELKDVKTYGGK